MRRSLRITPFLLLGFATLARSDEFPPDLVRWAPIATNPVFTGTTPDRWDLKIRERGWILIEDGTFHLWYTGYNEAKSPTRFLGHATSTDGVRWNRDPANPLSPPTEWVEDVCILKNDGVYYMFAEGKGDVAHLLTSKDRIHWDEQGPLDVRKVDGMPIPTGPYGTPTVWYEDGVWSLFYERGDRGVWLARSRDLKVWTNVQDEPVLAMGPDAYDRHAVAFDQIIKRDGVYYALYHANAHEPWQKDWTTNIARSRDLIHWEKYPGNPLVRNDSSSAMFVDVDGLLRLYTMHPEIRAFEPLPAK
ncbi:glycosylase [Tundrisphaera sp. TA3]|uniref:glycosylase n=1 Tax=Tundrisphaera sp. TA3 TaxID=3435775 RepID=UPI003EB900F8